MSAIDDAVKINGFKFRSWKKGSTWTDPFEENVFWSTTLLPPGTLIMEATSEEDMVIEIKKNSKKFNLSELSDNSKQKFKDYKIEDKIENGLGEV